MCKAEGPRDLKLVQASPALPVASKLQERKTSPVGEDVGTSHRPKDARSTLQWSLEKNN